MYGKTSIVYSNVWEDPELNRQALQVQEGETVLSITSGGCNSLSLLLENPERVISIDCNPAQVYLLNFKIAAFKELDHDELCDLFGVRIYKTPERITPDERLVLYGRIRKHLENGAKDFWDNHLDLIKKGIIYCGAVERFFGWYRKVAQTLYALDRADRLFFCADLEEQRRLYKRILKNRIRILNHMILNRFVLGIVKGRHSFKYVNNLRFGSNFNRKLKHAFTNIYLHENYFLSLILLGAFTHQDHLPPYLKKASFDTMKNNIGRIQSMLATLEDVHEKYGPNTVDKFNLSNIFEWFDDKAFNQIFRDVAALARPRSRLCYRYTLARPQTFDETNRDRFQPEEELATQLHAQDRAFMYESFHVYHTEGGHA